MLFIFPIMADDTSLSASGEKRKRDEDEEQPFIVKSDF
tara:strand:+ start:128 stop:241 length:114 start_codon:yes stop_codon:yes gene_type:complete